MSTGTSIIQDAYIQLGVESVFKEASPESLEYAGRILMGMLHLWKSFGINLSFTPLEAVGDELNEAADTRNAIVFNLAIELSTSVDNGVDAVVSEQLRNNARRTYEQVAQLCRDYSKKFKKVSGTQSKGQGNAGRFRNRRNYFLPGESLGG